MKRNALFLVLSGAFLPLIALAQLHSYGQGVSLEQIVSAAAMATWVIFTVVVVICFVLAGVLFLTAQGDPAKLQQARAAFIWGVAGVAVGIAAFSIIAIVGSII